MAALYVLVDAFWTGKRYVGIQGIQNVYAGVRGGVRRFGIKMAGIACEGTSASSAAFVVGRRTSRFFIDVVLRIDLLVIFL